MTTTDDAPRTYKWIGTRPVRHDGLDKVTGRARFAADHQLPGMLHGHVLRSPHAHARIVSIDTSAAEAMPGVKAVVTAADFPEMEIGSGDRYEPHNLMAREKVFYEGHAVAAVAAGTRRQARARGPLLLLQSIRKGGGGSRLFGHDRVGTGAEGALGPGRDGQKPALPGGHCRRGWQARRFRCEPPGERGAERPGRPRPAVPARLGVPRNHPCP